MAAASSRSHVSYYILVSTDNSDELATPSQQVGMGRENPATYNIRLED